MTNTDRILAALTAVDGQSDSELVKSSGVMPHQQVNQICRRLEASGQLSRVSSGGAIRNWLVGGAVKARPRFDTNSSVRASSDAGPNRSARELILIPCSGSKVRGGHRAIEGPSVVDLLPPSLAAELVYARQANAARARLDDSLLMRAVDRYSGGFYEVSKEALQLQPQGVVIISGGYGLLLPDEPIGYYERSLHPADWPGQILERCLDVLSAEVEAVTAFVARTTSYAAVVRRTPWRSGIRVSLVAPDLGGGVGAQSVVPRMLGRSFASHVLSAAVDAPSSYETDTRVSARTQSAAAWLSSPENAHPCGGFPVNQPDVSGPGLYSWWCDEEGLDTLSMPFGVRLPALVYAGQAGASSSVAGLERGATLRTRIGRNHLNGNVQSSTFRQTLSAVLRSPLGLQMEGRRLERESNERLSNWMRRHLRLATLVVEDCASLAHLEDAVLQILNPPLNLMGMPGSEIRTTLKRLRRDLRG